jgi:N-acetylglutamate synthase-like GNAT family acetyltransferase
MKIRRIKPTDIEWIKTIFKKEWKGEFIVTLGKIHKIETLDGFIAEFDNKKAGLVTFKITNQELEIISLNSFFEKRGIGDTLLKRTITFAKRKKAKRVWLITTNDNLDSLKFYQKRNFSIVKIYSNSIEAVRKLKPKIPKIGKNGIPLKDEIELEIKFRN